MSDTCYTIKWISRNVAAQGRQESIALKLQMIPEECILQWLNCRVCSNLQQWDSWLIILHKAIFSPFPTRDWVCYIWFSLCNHCNFFHSSYRKQPTLLFFFTMVASLLHDGCLPLLPHTRSTPSSMLMNNSGIICAMMLEFQASPKSFLNSSARCS